MKQLKTNSSPSFACIVIVLVGLSMGMQACEQSNNAVAKASQKVKSTTDSLYDEVIALHDEAMPKMGKLAGYKTAVRQKIDSLNTILIEQKKSALFATKARYDSLLVQLTTAEKSMNDWMENFNPDPKFTTADSLTAYFQAQKIAAQQMKDRVFAAIDSAKGKLTP